MNRDRGTIKWNAMMLPEHVKLLRQWKEEDEKIKKPSLDEWAMQELGTQVAFAYQYRLPIRLTLWEERGTAIFTTVIERVDYNRQSIYTEEGKEIAIKHLYGAVIMD